MARFTPKGKPQRVSRHADMKGTVQALGEDDLFRLLDRLETSAFLLILDSVMDPHNLGACLRTADGAGVQAVITAKDRCAPLNDTVRAVSCGAASNIPLIRVTNLARMIDQLKEFGIWIVGTDSNSERSIYEIDLTDSLAIVMGSEGSGLRRLTAEKCDHLVSFPMKGKVESLNVSVSAGICLYEAVRQRVSN